ncbi:MAG: cohesin domain-containing protein [SAR202 cluster bacterium]|nr:cohesin domain-containing protein [SAR202 cluster bacterium]MDP6715338.1 cohesin domain-containing protein [SAR202 cluster bacterium]
MRDRRATGKTASLLVAIAALVMLPLMPNIGFSSPVHADDVSEGLAQTGPSLTITEIESGLANSTTSALTPVTMRVTVESAQDIAGIQFKTLYDGQELTVGAGGVTRRSPPGFLFRSSVQNPDGFISVATAASRGTGNGNLVIADITFIPNIGPGQCADLTLAEVVAVDDSVPPEFVSVAPVHGSICVVDDEVVGAPIEVQPTQANAVPDEIITLELWTNSTTTEPISGVELYLDFDPTYLQVVDSKDSIAGVQIQHDAAALPIELVNTVNNSAGEIVFSSGDLSAPFPVGSFKVASITFKAISPTPESQGTLVKFSFSENRVTKVSGAGNVILGEHHDSLVTVHEVKLTVQFGLQGGLRTDEGWKIPVTVNLFTPGADPLLDTPELQHKAVAEKLGDKAQVVLTGITPSTYDVSVDSETTLLSLRRGVVVPREGATANLGALLEGDANGSCLVDILDFTLLGGSFLQSTGDAAFQQLADFDRTGVVNILDFTLLAENFLKMCPVVVPQP